MATKDFGQIIDNDTIHVNDENQLATKKLGTVDAGSETKPIFLKNGVPTECLDMSSIFLLVDGLEVTVTSFSAPDYMYSATGYDTISFSLQIKNIAFYKLVDVAINVQTTYFSFSDGTTSLTVGEIESGATKEVSSEMTLLPNKLVGGSPVTLLASVGASNCKAIDVTLGTIKEVE